MTQYCVEKRSYSIKMLLSRIPAMIFLMWIRFQVFSVCDAGISWRLCACMPSRASESVAYTSLSSSSLTCDRRRASCICIAWHSAYFSQTDHVQHASTPRWKTSPTHTIHASYFRFSIRGDPVNTQIYHRDFKARINRRSVPSKSQVCICTLL